MKPIETEPGYDAGKTAEEDSAALVSSIESNDRKDETIVARMVRIINEERSPAVEEPAPGIAALVEEVRVVKNDPPTGPGISELTHLYDDLQKEDFSRHAEAIYCSAQKRNSGDAIEANQVQTLAAVCQVAPSPPARKDSSQGEYPGNDLDYLEKGEDPEKFTQCPRCAFDGPCGSLRCVIARLNDSIDALTSFAIAKVERLAPKPGELVLVTDDAIGGVHLDAIVKLIKKVSGDNIGVLGIPRDLTMERLTDDEKFEVIGRILAIGKKRTYRWLSESHEQYEVLTVQRRFLKRFLFWTKLSTLCRRRSFRWVPAKYRGACDEWARLNGIVVSCLDRLLADVRARDIDLLQVRMDEMKPVQKKSEG